MKESEEEPSISVLPEECISDILSITSPRDASRVAAISKAFKKAAESDAVWEQFLPSDYRSIIAKAISPLVFETKKQLYLLLSESEDILLDGGNLAFKLDKESGKKCYMLGARDIVIVWGSTEEYWNWRPVSRSRFAEVAILKKVCWLEIKGTIGTVMLSRRSTYAAYLVFRILKSSEGLDVPIKTMVRVGGIKNENHNVYVKQPRGLRQTPTPATRRTRKDGWMEIELGEFYSDGGDNVNVALLFDSPDWKSGLIVEGIQFRPK